MEGNFTSIMPSQNEIYTFKCLETDDVIIGIFNMAVQGNHHSIKGTRSSPDGSVEFGIFDYHEFQRKGPLMRKDSTGTTVFEWYENDVLQKTISEEEFWQAMNKDKEYWFDIF